MTDPEKLRKILKKEAMEQDLKQKTSKADPRKQAFQLRLKQKIKISGIGGADFENSMENSFTTTTKKRSTKVSNQFTEKGNDHLPFPSLTSKIAKQLPGYPQKPKMKMVFNFKYFKEMFTHYSNDVRKLINMNLKLPIDVPLKTEEEFKSMGKKKKKL